jgi:NitT/TauT family transport system substrate-binding protein
VKRRSILALPAILALASAAATTGVAAQSTSPSGEPAASGAAGGKCNGETVRYELSFIPNVQHAGFLVAEAEGYYADEGIDVTFVPGGPSVDPTQDLPAGAADMAQIDYVQLVQARQQGVPIVAIAQNYKDPFFFWYAFKDSGINTIADWKGQKVGQIQVGAYPERDAMLIANGLQPTDITPVPQDFGVDKNFGQPNGFQIAEGVVFYHPALLNNPTFPIPGHDSHKFPDDFNVFRPQDLGAKMASQTTAVSEDYAKAHPDVIQCFLRASIRGWQKTFMDPQAAVTDTMKYVPAGAIPVQAEQSAINDVLPIVGSGADDPTLLQLTPDDYTDTIALLQGLDVLPADATPAGTYDDSFYNTMGPIAPVPSSAPASSEAPAGSGAPAASEAPAMSEAPAASGSTAP